VGTLLVSALLLLTTITPTFFDRSDIRLFDGQVLLARTVTNNPILNGGWFEATIDMRASQISAVGLVDQVHSTYEVNENGVLTYQTTWKTYATVSPIFGFIVQINPVEIVLVGGGPYTQDHATIRVERTDDEILYYLNGQLMYVSMIEAGLTSLRGSITGSAGASEPLLDRGELLR
jgi:hypothetical protein